MGTTLVRIHRSDRTPWWYSSDGSGRFDLTGLDGLGTCYLAELELGSFVEVFRDLTLVSEALVDAKRLSSLEIDRVLRLADCTSGRGRSFGVTAAIHSTEDYAKTQAWARALHADGLEGVRYLVSHDPRQHLIGVALFGTSNDDPDHPQPLSRDVLADAERIFGILVRPTHGSSRGAVTA